MKGQIGHYINYKNKPAKVGVGVTLLHYTDRSAGTITRISKSGNTIWFQEDTAKRSDDYGMSEVQYYKFTPNPQGRIYRASKRKDGQWRLSNDDRKVIVGHRDAYHDYSF